MGIPIKYSVNALGAATTVATFTGFRIEASCPAAADIEASAIATADNGGLNNSLVWANATNPDLDQDTDFDTGDSVDLDSGRENGNAQLAYSSANAAGTVTASYAVQSGGFAGRDCALVGTASFA